MRVDSLTNHMAVIWLDPDLRVLAWNGTLPGWEVFSRNPDPTGVSLVRAGLEKYDSQARNWSGLDGTGFLLEGDVWMGRIRQQGAPEQNAEGCLLTIMRTGEGVISGYSLQTSGISPVLDHMAAVEHNDHAVIYLNPEGGIVYRNRRAREKSLEKGNAVTGKPVWDGLDWRNLREERESLIRHFRLAVQSGETQRLIMKQGRRFSSPDRSIIQVIITPIRDDMDNIHQVLMEESYVPVDVQLEIRERTTESAFKSFLDQNPLPAWMVDVQGKLIAASWIYADLFGLNAADMGKDLMQLIPTPFVLQYTKHHEKILKNGEHLHELENWMGPDGRVRTYIVHKFPIRSGRTITMIGSIAFEVTEKMRIGEEYRDRYEMFSLANEASQDLIWDWDINTDKVRTQGDQALNWSEDDHLGYSSEEFFSRMHPDDKYRIESLLKNGLADKGTDRIQGLYRLRVKGGADLPILDRARILRDEHGQPYRVIGSAMHLSGNLLKPMRMLLSEADNGRSNANINSLMNGTDGMPREDLEIAIRRALAKSDPVGRISASISITGMDRHVLAGFDTEPLLRFLGRFFDSIKDAGLVRNLSLYVWSEGGQVFTSVAHDGISDWKQELSDWADGSGITRSSDDGKDGNGHLTVIFPLMGEEARPTTSPE